MQNKYSKTWQEKILGELCEVGAGNSAPQKEECFKNGTYPFIRTADVGKIHFGCINTSNDLLNEIGIKGLKLFPKETILIPKSGASTYLNHRVMMLCDGYVVSHLATVKSDNTILNSKFLLYYLSLIDSKDLIQDQNYPSLNLPTIKGIIINYPPLQEQERIVGILDKVFENIEQAKKNAEQNLQNAKNLFDSELENIFTGNIEDWEKLNVGEIIKLEYGKALPYSDRCNNGENPVYGANGIKDRTNKYLYDKPSIIVGRKGSVGELNYVESKFWALDVTYYVKFDENQYNLNFLYYLLKRLKLQTLARGVKPGLNRNEVYNLNVAIPKINTQQQIVEKLDKLQEQVKSLEAIYEQKIKDLEELKQSILQKAFNGEL